MLINFYCAAVPLCFDEWRHLIISFQMQVKPPSSFTPEEINYLTDRIQNGGTEVVEVG